MCVGGWVRSNSAVGGAVLSAASGRDVNKGSKAYSRCNQYGTIRLMSVSEINFRKQDGKISLIWSAESSSTAKDYSSSRLPDIN